METWLSWCQLFTHLYTLPLWHPISLGWGSGMAVGRRAGWAAQSLCFLLLQKQLWRWIDGSTNLYRPWNPRTKSEDRHCAEMNPKDRKFAAHLPSLQAAAPFLNLLGANGVSLSLFPTPFHPTTLPYRSVALTQSTLFPLYPLRSLCWVNIPVKELFNSNGRRHEGTHYDKCHQGKKLKKGIS